MNLIYIPVELESETLNKLVKMQVDSKQVLQILNF
jgi:hypothetical protein